MTWLKPKKPLTPSFMKDVTVPKKLDLIVKAFFAESPKAAKKLLIQAAKAIYGSDEDEDFCNFSMKQKHIITNEELEDICTLMQGIKPNDMLEALCAAQIVVSHMIGMRKLAMGHSSEQYLGLKMLRFSLDAMQQLQKKRCGGMQNITVNYNYNGKTVLDIPIVPINNASDCSDAQ